jgi:hypothetical protein
VLATLAGCSSSDSPGGKDAGPSPKASVAATSSARPSSAASHAAPRQEADVRITKAGVENHPVWGLNAYVVHYVTNHGKQAADYFAPLEFLDKDDDHLGSTGITADKLGAGSPRRATRCRWTWRSRREDRRQ